MNASRRGFTLPDLIVVSAGVVLLLGMLLPAAQEVKEAEKRKQCVNNLKQLGLAAYNFQTTHRRLPPGWLGPLDNEKPAEFERVQGVGVFAHLLPFLGQDAANREVQKIDPVGYFGLGREHRAWYLLPELLKAATARIEDLLCPSAPEPTRASDGVIVAVHFANKDGDPKQPFVGTPLHSFPRTDKRFEKLGATSYFGVSGMYGRGTNVRFSGTQAGLARFEGVFTNRSRNSADALTSADGTSNTLLFGEATGGRHERGPDKADTKAPTRYVASWMGCGALPTAGGLARYGDRSFWYQFSSAHEGVVNFCMADGAVRALRFGTTATVLFPTPEFPSEPADRSAASPYWVLQELAGMRDGGVRRLDALVVKDAP